MPAAPHVFIADGPGGQDALGIETLVSVLTELAAHKNVELPFCIGLLGAPGSGKSFALARLGSAIDALSAQAASQHDSPYLSGVQIVRADAAHLDGEPATAIAGALYDGLGQTVPEFVEEALRAVRDPHAAVTEAAERLDQAQRRLHLERDNLTEVESRRARLFETLLYETPGSPVDAFVRTNRPRIASRLHAFGFPGDPILNYKGLVASLAAARGPGARIAMELRALWAFKGQTRLLIYALILVLTGAGLGWAADHQAAMLEPLRAHETGAPIAAWFEAHMGMFTALGKAAFAGAVLAVLFNFWRAFRFLQPILRGVTLLKTELVNRQHELDSAYAHQTRRVDGLAAEVERAARLHADASAHADKATPQSGLLREASPFRGSGERTKALAFVTALASSIGQKRQGAEPARNAPRRIVFMLDNLDAVPVARACEIMNAVHGLLTNPAFVTVIAADPRRMAQAGPAVEADLEKWIQVPVRIDAVVKDHAGFIAHLIGRRELATETKAPLVQHTRQTSFDRPLSDEESQLLIELAPVAGRSARSLKRFVNLYRLTRAIVPDHSAVLAFMLALESGGTPGEIELMATALAEAKPGADLDLSQQPRLSALLATVRTLEREPLVEAMKRVVPVVETFSFRM